MHIIINGNNPKDLEKRIKAIHEAAIKRLTDHFGANTLIGLHKEFKIFEPLNVKLCGRLKRALGTAYVNKRNLNFANDELKIHKNYFIDSQNYEKLEDTYTHELAHILIERLYPKININHGHKWQQLHKILGGNGQQFHTCDVKKYARPHAYTCKCLGKQHFISTKRHNIILRRGTVYKCSNCRHEIKYLESLK